MGEKSKHNVLVRINCGYLIVCSCSFIFSAMCLWNFREGVHCTYMYLSNFDSCPAVEIILELGD